MQEKSGLKNEERLFILFGKRENIYKNLINPSFLLRVTSWHYLNSNPLTDFSIIREGNHRILLLKKFTVVSAIYDTHFKHPDLLLI